MAMLTAWRGSALHAQALRCLCRLWVDALLLGLSLLTPGRPARALTAYPHEHASSQL